jgi:hypothetical protein
MEQMEKKEYQQPELVEYGPIGQLTLGSFGPQFDMNFTGGALVVHPVNHLYIQSGIPLWRVLPRDGCPWIAIHSELAGCTS